MKTTINIGVGTADEFFKRSLDRAKKLDRGERLQPEMRITFEDPAELIRVMTGKRVELIHAIRRSPAAVSELALTLNRDRAAVDRDVKLLERLGLLATSFEDNPGHGRRKVVRSLAARYELTATI